MMTDLAFSLDLLHGITFVRQRQQPACVRIFLACVVTLQSLAAFAASFLFCVRHRAIPLGTYPIHRKKPRSQ